MITWMTEAICLIIISFNVCSKKVFLFLKASVTILCTPALHQLPLNFSLRLCRFRWSVRYGLKRCVYLFYTGFPSNQSIIVNVFLTLRTYSISVYDILISSSLRTYGDNYTPTVNSLEYIWYRIYIAKYLVLTKTVNSNNYGHTEQKTKLII